MTTREPIAQWALSWRSTPYRRMRQWGGRLYGACAATDRSAPRWRWRRGVIAHGWKEVGILDTLRHGFRSSLRRSVTLAAELVGSEWAVFAMRVDEDAVRPIVWSRLPRMRAGRSPTSTRRRVPEPYDIGLRGNGPMSMVFDSGLLAEAPAPQWFSDGERDYGWLDATGRLSRPTVCGVPVSALGSVRAVLLLYLPCALPHALRRVAAACADQLGDLIENEERYLRERRLVQDLHLSRQMLVQAEERIRREIAEEIHGSVQNALLSVAYRIDQVASALSNDPALAPLSTELAGVHDNITTMQMDRLRRLSHRLHPVDLQVGIVPALKTLVGSWPRAGDVDLDIAPAARAVLNGGQLCAGCCLAAYRLAEEGLTNTFKHAQARRAGVAVSLGRMANAARLIVEVRDDGRGFDPESVKKGLGLNGLRARLEDAWAEWRVESEPGRGTTLAACFALPCGHLPAARFAPRAAPRARVEARDFAAMGAPTGMDG